jgi:hypothetical protein
MLWAAGLLETACDLGIARLRAPAGDPLEALPAKERRAISERLSASAREHRDLWLETSRPGGLEESVGWIEQVVARLS